MKEYGIILDFKDKMITIDEIKMQMRNINICKALALSVCSGLTLA